MKKKYEQAALLFRALSDPNRLAIIDMIKTEEKCACKILEELQITQPTLSHHMKILCEAGFVESNKQGKWMHYTINVEGFNNAKKILDELEICMLVK